MKLTKYLNRYNALAMVSGIVLPFAFAPFYFFIIAFISPALLLYTWSKSTAREAAIRGLLFGLGFFGTGISWVFVSIHVFGQAPIALAVFITFIFVAYLSLFIAGAGYCLNKLCPENNLFKLLLVFPSSWLVFEALRGWLFTGFPWLFLGYSQTPFWLRNFAPIVGVYGLTFLCTFISGLLIACLYKKTRFRLIAFSTILAISMAGYLLGKLTWTHVNSAPMKVTMIQGNISQDLKWQPQQLVRTLNLYAKYTQANWSSQIIIWPEAAIPMSLENATEFVASLKQAALRHNSTVITGIPIIDGEEGYNSIIAVGTGSGVYHKRHLVPFGEYIPLRPVYEWIMQMFQIPMSNFQKGSKEQTPLMANGIAIAPYICYEVAYPLEFLLFLPQAEMLLTVTDDSWFGHSFALAQHLQMAQLRSLETGRFLLFNSNTGITAIITPKGEIQKAIPPFQEMALTSTVTAMSGQTPWMILRMYPIWSLVLLTVVVACRRSLKYRAGVKSKKVPSHLPVI